MCVIGLCSPLHLRLKFQSRAAKTLAGSHCLNWIVFLSSVGITLSVNVEQRINVKFCVKLGKSVTEPYDLLKTVYDDECLSRTQDFERLKRFEEGKEEIGDNQRPGRPNTSKQALTSKKSVKLFDKIVV